METAENSISVKIENLPLSTGSSQIGRRNPQLQEREKTIFMGVKGFGIQGNESLPARGCDLAQ